MLHLANRTDKQRHILNQPSVTAVFSVIEHIQSPCAIQSTPHPAAFGHHDARTARIWCKGQFTSPVPWRQIDEAALKLAPLHLPKHRLQARPSTKEPTKTTSFTSSIIKPEDIKVTGISGMIVLPSGRRKAPCSRPSCALAGP